MRSEVLDREGVGNVREELIKILPLLKERFKVIEYKGYVVIKWSRFGNIYFYFNTNKYVIEREGRNKKGFGLKFIVDKLINDPNSNKVIRNAQYPIIKRRP